MSAARTTYDEWLIIGAKAGWDSPDPAGWVVRLPIVRHVRTLWLLIRVEAHSAFWGSIGLIDTGFDDWVLFGMWRGWV